MRSNTATVGLFPPAPNQPSNEKKQTEMNSAALRLRREDDRKRAAKKRQMDKQRLEKFQEEFAQLGNQNGQLKDEVAQLLIQRSKLLERVKNQQAAQHTQTLDAAVLETQRVDDRKQTARNRPTKQCLKQLKNRSTQLGIRNGELKEEVAQLLVQRGKLLESVRSQQAQQYEQTIDSTPSPTATTQMNFFAQSPVPAHLLDEMQVPDEMELFTERDVEELFAAWLSTPTTTLAP